MRITYVSKQGQHHNESQDCILINNQVINNSAGAFNDNITNICIADGVGGVPGGYEASSYLLHHFKVPEYVGDEVALRDYLLSLNRELIAYAAKIDEKKAMASTFTGLVVIGHSLYVMHAGNTRLYACIGGRLKQITTDHTNYQALISDGIDEVDAAMGGRNVIYCCFGTGREEYLKSLEVFKLELDTAPEYLILTTDGIHDYIEEQQFETILNDNLDDRNKILELVKAATLNGSDDDKTVAIIRRKLI